MNETTLYQAVKTLAGVTHTLDDADLDLDWTWRDHSEGLRFALLGTYHELRDLSVTLMAGRLAEGIPVTAAQHVLGQYHAAFRDLEANLLGVADGDLDRIPAEGEWSLRQVLAHMIGADRGFFALVYYAVDQHRSGLQPSRPSAEELKALFGPGEEFDQVLDNGDLAGIQEYHQDLHNRILHEMAALSQDELWALSRFWEPEPQPIRYRLHRFDAHLRQHTIQVEKTLAAIGHVPSEALRLLRLVYNALAEIEGILIGAWDFGYTQQSQLAVAIVNRAEEVAVVAKGK
jgi:uncharacterized damage-inducible protein DinB